MGVFQIIRAQLRPLRRQARVLRARLAREWARRRWHGRTPGVDHRLKAPLIVSLTSFPARFPTLRPTLECLMTQNMRPDRVILWIAHDDMRALPKDVAELADHGLQIELCDDLRSFKKIIPALRRFPGAYIATADDDVYYPADWLRTLISGLEKPNVVPCHRAHRIRFDADGAPLPYAHWDLAIAPGPAASDIFPTGVGGVLYPPGSLAQWATDEALFMRATPTADDVWLYWMARLNGWRFQKVGPSRNELICWPRTQDVALQDINMYEGAGNDRCVAAMARLFGPAWREDFSADQADLRPLALKAEHDRIVSL